MKTRLLAVLAVVVVGAFAVQAQAQDSRAKARDVVAKNIEAVVWVSSVVKLEISAGGRSMGNPEDKVLALGTVIDPSGLTVLALSAIDPGSSLQGRKMNVGGENVELVVKSEHNQVKIEIGDKEFPARIILKDPDLDLAFVIPEKADTNLGVKPLKLEKAPKLELLDELVCLARMVKALDQAPAAAMSEVSGIVTKPRTFFLGGRQAGGPVLTLDGTVVGITATYKTEAGKQESATLVIVPAEDVLEIAMQALAKKDQPATSEPATTGPATTATSSKPTSNESKTP